MKFLLIILLLISGYASAQTTYYIRADSTKLQKVGSNNELILQNSTRTRTGAYLKNISNGITGFFYAIDSAWMSTDSTLVVRRGDGNDTLLIRGSGISATPGLQAVITADPVLTADNTIDGGGSLLKWQQDVSTNIANIYNHWNVINVSSTAVTEPYNQYLEMNLDGSGAVSAPRNIFGLIKWASTTNSNDVTNAEFEMNVGGSGTIGGGQSGGVSAALVVGATGNVGVYSGFRTSVQTTAGSNIGIYEGVSIDGWSNAGTAGDVFGFFYGGYANTGAGTTTNSYGLWIDSLYEAGTTNTYAIYTKNGNVRLGALPTGAATDSIMTWEASTGIVRKRNVASIISGGTIPISSLTASAATNGLTIGHAQTWTSSLTTTNPLTLTSSTITSGNILNITGTGTAINNGAGLNIAFTGVNANASRTTNGAKISVANTGTTSINRGILLTVQDAENNHGINVTASGGVDALAIVYEATGGTGTNRGLTGSAGGGTNATGGFFLGNGASATNYGVQGGAIGVDARAVFGAVSGTTTLGYGGYFSNSVTVGTQYGVFGEATGAGTTNYGGSFSATGATTNNAINIAAGALTLNGSAGTSGQVLTSAGANTLPTWTTPSAGGAAPGNFGNVIINRNNVDATPGSDSLDFESATGLTVKGNITSSTLTANRVVYAGTAGLLSTSANLTYDNANMVITAAGGVGTGLTITSTNAASYASANFITPTGGNGFQIGKYGASGTVPNGVFFYNPDNSPITFTTNNNRIMDVTGAGNLLLGGTTDPASAYYTIGLHNGGAPTGSLTNGVIIYSEDVAASAELKVRDEAGNITVLSPHHFEGIPMGKSEDMAWSYYSERDGKYITVDMLKAIRTIEDLTRRVEKLEKELNMKSKKPVKLVYTGKVKAKKPVPINKQP